MTVPWLLALKVIPWGDVIEQAPKVLAGARQLLDRQRASRPVDPSVVPRADQATGADAPSLDTLAQRLTAAEQRLQSQAQAQEQLTQTLAELAELNTRLIGAVATLRLRSRMLMGAAVVLALGVVASLMR
jgi:signal transduction histidine kinase